MFYGRGGGIDSLFFCLIELKTLTPQLYICVERKTYIEMKKAEFDKSIVTINENTVEISVEEIVDYIAYEMPDGDIKKMFKRLLERDDNGFILKMMFDLACSKITSSEEYESTTKTAVKLAKSLFNNDFNEIW